LSALRHSSLPQSRREPSSKDDPAAFFQVVTEHLRSGWRIDRAGTWTRVAPSGSGLRDQGWKIHLSAVPSSAQQVLERATPVLVAAGCPFKFAASPGEVARLNGRHFDRGAAGKFLTVYPPDDDDLPELARALDEATEGLPGPHILSDRPFRAGSLVHFRFGGFVRKLRLAANGVYEPVVTAPDGTCVADRRAAWFDPPSWAPANPFPAPPRGAQGAPRGVLVGDRFLLRGAIRHANKGGVYRATDQRTGEEVVVKQGRRYVEVRPDGGDVRDLLRNEARILERLAPTGVVPRVHALLELAEHTFLVVEAIEGVSLADHQQRLHRGRAGRPDPEAVRRTAARLADLVAAVHREGVVIRDLTPANVLVLPDGGLRLIDLELAGVPGQDVVPGGSPGYAAPEQWTGRRTSPAADLHSLGAILFALATGAEPVLAADDERDAQSRIAGWLERAARDNPTAAELGPLILGLVEEDPGRRPPLDSVREALHGGTGLAARTHDDTGRLLDDGLTHLIASGGLGRDPDREAEPGTERWWPADLFGATTDPCNVYYGAAGILGVLAAAHGHRPGPELSTATTRAARWLERHAAREPEVLPGLHFGRSGTYWALLEAGIALGDEDLITRTADAAERLPVAGPVPDVSHGIAGTGLTALRFWRHTGRGSFLRQAGECADALLGAAVRGPEGVAWPVPPYPPHLPDGATHHGFAHGTAGIAAFLLDAATITGRADCLATARLAGRTLCAATLWGEGGTARWSAGPADQVPLTGWCSGAAGVGGFLLRLWRVTGEADLLSAARGAAAAVRHDIWQSRPVHCHGTAGSIEYLMDVAEATGEERNATWAREAVSAMAARAVVRDGLLLTPDHSGVEVFPGWGVGTAGVAAALLRLDGAPLRLFMPPLPGVAAGPPERAASCRTDRVRPPERKSP
jgi:tRNA A-37 threonylcarbamoyl transferase component Bud32